MANSNSVLVSNTHTLEGWIIDQYVGTIFAHVVAGTNIFSDVAAAFRDLFGGRAKSYQGQLNFIQEEVVKELRTKAMHLGCNCVIGVTIDVDEISGSGKSMFMVTACGTAVVAREHPSKMSQVRKAVSMVTGYKLALEMQGRLLLEKAKDPNYCILPNDVELAIQFDLEDMIDPLLSRLEDDIQREKAVEMCTRFVTGIQSSAVNKRCYGAIWEKAILFKSGGGPVAKAISEVIANSFIVDYNAVMEMLKSDNIGVCAAGLNLARRYKEHYTLEDCTDLESILELINALYNKEQTEKRLLRKDFELLGDLRSELPLQLKVLRKHFISSD